MPLLTAVVYWYMVLTTQRVCVHAYQESGTVSIIRIARFVCDWKPRESCALHIILKMTRFSCDWKPRESCACMHAEIHTLDPSMRPQNINGLHVYMRGTIMHGTNSFHAFGSEHPSRLLDRPLLETTNIIYRIVSYRIEPHSQRHYYCNNTILRIHTRESNLHQPTNISSPGTWHISCTGIWERQQKADDYEDYSEVPIHQQYTTPLQTTSPTTQLEANHYRNK